MSVAYEQLELDLAAAMPAESAEDEFRRWLLSVPSVALGRPAARPLSEREAA